MLSSNASRGKTKIRPPKKIVTNPIDFDKSWGVLESAINDIQHKNASNLSFEELYRRSYNLVLRKHGQLLYNNVSKAIQDHLAEVRLNILKEANDENEYSEKKFLQDLKKEWEDHLLCTRIISDIMMYLDRVFAKEQHLPLIYDVGLNSFRDYLIKFENHTIGFKVINIVLNNINKSRHGVIIDKFMIRSVIEMFEALNESYGENKSIQAGDNYYIRYFEPRLLESSHNFFINITTELLSQGSGTVYIENITNLIKEEEQRADLYLSNVSVPKLVDLMDNDLITQHIETVLKMEMNGLNTWISENNFNILSTVYSLIARVDSHHEALKRQLRLIILATGEELSTLTEEAIEQNESTNKGGQNEESNEGSEKPSINKVKKVSSKEKMSQFAQIWIQKILDMKRKFDIIINKCFENNTSIVAIIDSSFVEFLNKNNKISEYLSLFIDYSIKKSFKDKSQEECEEILSNAIIIFRFIKDKDIFERYYKNHLARRLLQQKSITNEYEMSMITRLKQEIGSNFTTNLEGMFKDIKLSQDLSSEFQSNIINNDKLLKEINGGRKLDMETNVLTTNFWPMHVNKELDINYPIELMKLKEKFEFYYQTKLKGRNLTWAPNFGTVDIRMHYPKKTYEVNLSTYAAIIILTLFKVDDDNDDESKIKDEYTFEEIYELTKIPKPDLIRHLQSIAVAQKTRLLKKVPMSRDILPTDKFSINEKFSSPNTKIKVLTVASNTKAENEQERSVTMEYIEKSRIIETEAAVVRIMKARKRLNHNELLLEVVKQLSNRFKPSPIFIKQRIEDLIEKEYLKRDDNQRNIYEYLA